MTITVLPPVSFTPNEVQDISTLMNVIISLSTILDGESAIQPASGNTMTLAAISSLNNTLTDASDRVDAIINPIALP